MSPLPSRCRLALALVAVAACGGGSSTEASAGTGASSASTGSGSHASSGTSTSSASATTGSSSSGAPAACGGATGCISDFAGSYHTPGTTDGVGTAARFTRITSITGDGQDLIWVSDADTVRQIQVSTGKVTTILPTPMVALGAIGGLTYDITSPSGDPELVISDDGEDVLQSFDVGSSGIGAIAGTPNMQGTTESTFTLPTSVAMAETTLSTPYTFVIDGSVVRWVFNENITTVGPDENTPTVFGQPAGILVELEVGAQTTFTLVVADAMANKVLAYDSDASMGMWTNVSTCGSGTSGHADGACASASFASPHGMAWKDPATAFVADTGNNRVRSVAIGAASGMVATTAGTGTAGHTVAVGTQAELDAPTALYVTADGHDLFIVDADGTEIRRQSL